MVLRELAPQAAAQTRTYQARLKPAPPRRLPLGATATLAAERATADTPVAAVPAAAITQNGGKPAVWVVRPQADATRHRGTRPGDRARLPQRRRAAVRPARRRAGRDGRRAEDGARPAVALPGAARGDAAAANKVAAR